MFRGFWPTLAREVPAFSVYFASYEWMTRGAAQVPTWQLLLAGGAAGTLSWVITYPVDVVKSRVQADGVGRYSGALHCLRTSLAAEGPAFLFRGLSSTVLRAFPTNAATFAAVAWTMRLLQDAELCDAVPEPAAVAVAAVAASPAAAMPALPARPTIRISLYSDHQHPFLEWLALHCHLVATEMS